MYNYLFFSCLHSCRWISECEILCIGWQGIRRKHYRL